MASRRRVIRSAVLALLLTAAPLTVLAPTVAAAPRACTLVVTAMPSELGPLLDRLQHPTVTQVGDRRFHAGAISGRDVVLAMTGIGLTNAEETTDAALRTFECVGGVVFSGVAGGARIGDVTVPSRWTEDRTRWIAVDHNMFRAAAAVTTVPLSRDAPRGDATCRCTESAHTTVVTLAHQPTVVLGGDGRSTDPFGGRRLPCVPGGGDIIGCATCQEAGPQPPDPRPLAPLVDPELLRSYLDSPQGTDSRYVADDMETARVAAVAAAHGLPFIGFRGVSDGAGDPLGLTDWIAQFFVYHQLAADNAAAVTAAFLSRWSP